MENNNSTDFQLRHDHKEFHHFSPSKVRVRCPQCFKLFSINAQNVTENRPRFACTSCSTQFWIPFPECLEQQELLGFPVSWLEEGTEEVSTHLKGAPLTQQDSLQTEKFDNEPALPLNSLKPSCPKCGQVHLAEAKECASCGIIFSQFEENAEDVNAGFRVTRQLRDSWKLLINDFDKPELHDEFIQLCRSQQALDYAAYRYGRVHQACPEDEVSKKMIAQIEGLIAVASGIQTPEADSEVQEVKPVAWYSRFSFSSVVIGLGCILIAIGYFLPAFRNIVGLGAATIFLAIAFRMYFPRN